MGNRWKKAFDDFVSYRFAAAVIASLFFASLAKNPDGYCGIGGTGVSCPVGLATSAD